MTPQKIIVVFCHSRAELLNLCLSSIVNASGFNGWNLVIVHQKGFTDVETILRNYNQFIHTLISVEPSFNFPLGNINYNRILGTKIGFDILGADYLLGIEEDNLISLDALSFIDFAYKKYQKSNSFRGINLGSIEFGNTITPAGYSLLRFGLHGSAGVLTKKTWCDIKAKKLLDFDLNNPNFAWDARIEFYLKTGFMVTPNLSRNLDLGYGGTFAPANKTDPYFYAIRKSWVNNKKKLNYEYAKIQVIHGWRSDAVEFKRIHSFIYFIKSKDFLSRFSNHLGITKLIKKLII
jgi:hypothetical protein